MGSSVEGRAWCAHLHTHERDEARACRPEHAGKVLDLDALTLELALRLLPLRWSDHDRSEASACRVDRSRQSRWPGALRSARRGGRQGMRVRE